MKKTIRDFSLNCKIVVLRCDLNVSIKDGKIIDIIFELGGYENGKGKKSWMYIIRFKK